MIDLHCHILPELDDGATDFNEAIQMAKIAARDGIRTIVATPHIDQITPNIIEQVKIQVRRVNSILKANSIPVTIITGAETISFNSVNCKDATIGNSSYILVEFPMSYLPASSWDDLAQLTEQGLRPIIAHPERNQAIIHNPNLLFDLLGDDILVQLTAGSLLGDFGPSVRECSFFLLQHDIIDVIASDAHSAIHRTPTLSIAVKKAAKIIGKNKATAMVTKNPQLILENKPLER